MELLGNAFPSDGSWKKEQLMFLNTPPSKEQTVVFSNALELLRLDIPQRSFTAYELSALTSLDSMFDTFIKVP